MDVSDALQRLQYKFAAPGEERDECEEAFWLKTTIDRDINGTLSFVVPPDQEAFTDVNSAYMSVTFRVLRANGDKMDESDLVFLSPGSLPSLFESCQVFLNGDALEPTTAYSWAACLASYLGMSRTNRGDIWEPLAGMRLPGWTSSRLKPGDEKAYVKSMLMVSNSRDVTFTGRLMSDFMQSCAQLIPPGMKLEVNLRRTRDAFPICCTTADATVQYKIDISTASLFLRRVKMCKPVLERTLASIAEGGRLAYTRMLCTVNQIPAQGVSYRVGNLFGGRELPHALYLVLVNQQAFAGAQHYLGNFFESGYLQSLQVLRNGRPVLTQPIRTQYGYKDDGYSLDVMKTEAREPFLSMAKAMDAIADSRSTTGLGYNDFLSGCIVNCVQLNSCGGKRMKPGFLDVELVLQDSPHREPMLLLAFGEFDKILQFDQNLHLLPN